LLLAPLGPLAAGVFGWLDPSEAWVGVLLPVGTAIQTTHAWERGKLSEWERQPRFIALKMGYAVLCAVAGPIGAWLAP
jgi:hypothetical protein